MVAPTAQAVMLPTTIRTKSSLSAKWNSLEKGTGADDVFCDLSPFESPPF